MGTVQWNVDKWYFLKYLSRLNKYFRHDWTKSLFLLNVILDAELVYRDPTGGLSIISTENLSTRSLMTNSTFVSILFVC